MSEEEFLSSVSLWAFLWDEYLQNKNEIPRESCWVVAEVWDTSQLERIPGDRVGVKKKAEETMFVGPDRPPIYQGQNYHLSDKGEVIVGYGHTTDPPRNSKGVCQFQCFSTPEDPIDNTTTDNNSSTAANGSVSTRKRKRSGDASASPVESATKRKRPVCLKPTGRPGSALRMEFVWKCAHSVCRGCLEQMNSHGVSHQCPVCRAGWA